MLLAVVLMRCSELLSVIDIGAAASAGATPLWKTAASQKNSPKEESRAPPRPPLRDFSVSMPRLSLSDVDLNLLPQQVKAALDFLVLLNPCDIVTDALAAQQPTLLPPQQEAHRGRRTLVLDLDETLVHCHCQAVPSLGSADLDLELESGEPKAALPPAYIGAAYMQACIHTCRIYVRMYISAYLHTCMRTWIHIYVYIQAYVDFESRELEG
ncbi:PSR1 [Symbiodinium microadriaticum]|nr:PSR1 [Symbiodinium microadriaticum]CAE7942188.1 PSR1 [Symbiodinium sp. KB8]